MVGDHMGILGAVVLPKLLLLPNLRPSRVLLPSPFFLQPNLHQPCVYYGVCQNCVHDVLPTQTCVIATPGTKPDRTPLLEAGHTLNQKFGTRRKLRPSQTCVQARCLAQASPQPNLCP